MDACKTILFVHGILGKPDFFSFMSEAVPAGWTIQDIVLEGHCSTATDFGSASMGVWKRQVADAVATLKATNDVLVIAAHSMGTLFAIRAAVDGLADGLFLLNPPLRLHLTGRLFSVPFKIFIDRIADDDIWTLAAKDAYSIAPDRNPLHYLGWPKRYLELFGEIWRTRKIMGTLEVPAHIFYSAKDEMVSPRSKSLFNRNPMAETVILKNSGHYYYSPADKGLVIESFRRLLRKF